MELALVQGMPVPVPLASLLDLERERNGDLETEGASRASKQAS